MKKGEIFSLSKKGANLHKIRVCLGWKTPKGLPYDLDASCILLGENDKCRDIHDFVCFASKLKRPKLDEYGNVVFNKKYKLDEDGNKVYMDWPMYEYFSRCQSVTHLGDILGGHGEDDEQIVVDLDRIPCRAQGGEVKTLLFVVTIYEWNQRKNSQGKNAQSFRDIESAYVRILDEADQNKQEVQGSRYDLAAEDKDGDYSAFLLGKLYRDRNRWVFQPLGEGLKNTDIDDLFLQYGLNPNDIDENAFQEEDEDE